MKRKKKKRRNGTSMHQMENNYNPPQQNKLLTSNSFHGTLIFLTPIHKATKVGNIQRFIARIALFDHPHPSLHLVGQDPQRRLTEQCLGMISSHFLILAK